MLHALPDYRAAACILVIQMVLIVNASDVSKPVCRQRQAQEPRVGQRCVSDTEVYINKTGLQHHCTLSCMRDPNCQVINFNIIGSYCLIGGRPCLSVENDTDLVTIFMSARKPCLKWVRKYDSDEHNPISFPEANDPSDFLSVAQCIIGKNKIHGKMVASNWAIYCSLGGKEMKFTENQTEILTLSQECNISWVPYDYTSTNPLPTGIVIGGQLNGIHLYIARKYAAHVAGNPPRYSSGYYDNVNGLGHFQYHHLDFIYQAMEVLVVKDEMWSLRERRCCRG